VGRTVRLVAFLLFAIALGAASFSARATIYTPLCISGGGDGAVGWVSTITLGCSVNWTWTDIRDLTLDQKVPVCENGEHGVHIATPYGVMCQQSVGGESAVVRLEALRYWGSVSVATCSSPAADLAVGGFYRARCNDLPRVGPFFVVEGVSMIPELILWAGIAVLFAVGVVAGQQR